MTNIKVEAKIGEKMQYLAHKVNDNTIRFIVHYKGDIDSDILCRAVGKVVSSVDVLHGSFIAGTLGAHWEINEDYETLDYYECVEIEDDVNIDKVSMEYAVKAIPHRGKTQMKCVLIQGIGECAVVLNLSHLCVDGSDGRYLLYKVAEAYNLICKNGNADNIDIKNGDRSPLQVCEKLTKEEYKIIKKKELSSGVKSGFTYPTEEDGHLNMVRRYIPKDMLVQVKEYVKKYNASVNDVLLAAFYHTYAEVEKLDRSTPISVMSMMDLRKHCIGGDSKGLSNISGLMPTILKQGISDRIEDTLVEIVAQTRKIKEDPYAGLYGMPRMYKIMNNVPLGLMQSVAKKMYGSMGLGITNMGNIQCSKIALDGIIPDRGMFGGPLKNKPSMQISAISFDGEMALSIVGKYTDEDAKYLEDMLSKVVIKICAMGFLESAKLRLKEEELTCIIYADKNIYTSKKRGVKPLLELIYSDRVDKENENSGLGTFKGAIAVDKVVGKAAAFLYVILGIKVLHAMVISRSALSVLTRAGVDVTFDSLVSYIENRNKDGRCPMESAVWDIDNPNEALRKIEETLEDMVEKFEK